MLRWSQWLHKTQRVSEPSNIESQEQELGRCSVTAGKDPSTNMHTDDEAKL